ncbi:MAG: hypothetical protein QGI83_22365 [Candidatus Latescibacteria bacterium]|jgi:hypothetical protein|nr:hypothetical protein [Candidatus Latescibacterota bacterium]
MKIILPVVLTFLVGAGAIPYVYGFRKAFSENPFIFAGIANFALGVILLGISFAYGGIERQYAVRNVVPIGLCVLGLVVANIANYFIITRYGASYWLLSSLFMMLIPSFVVGYLIFKETFNVWIVPCVFCALLTVAFFGLAKR